MLKTFGMAVAVSALALSAPALAADPAMEMTDTSPDFWMVFDLSASGWWGDEDGTYETGPYYWDEEADGFWYGVEGSAAFEISPDHSAQLDLWFEKYDGHVSGYDGACYYECGYYDYDVSGSQAGTEGHLTWEGADHRLAAFGGMSFHDDGDAYGWGGIEGAYYHGNWRLKGEVGVETGIGGAADYYDYLGWWATGVLTYYHNPNLAITGWAGVSGANDDYYDFETKGTNWGVEIEHKRDNLPFTLYAGYDGYTWDSSNTDYGPTNWDGIEHEIYVGMRIFLNDSTIQDVDRHVW